MFNGSQLYTQKYFNKFCTRSKCRITIIKGMKFIVCQVYYYCTIASRKITTASIFNGKCFSKFYRNDRNVELQLLQDRIYCCAISFHKITQSTYLTVNKRNVSTNSKSNQGIKSLKNLLFARFVVRFLLRKITTVSII